MNRNNRNITVRNMVNTPINNRYNTFHRTNNNNTNSSNNNNKVNNNINNNNVNDDNDKTEEEEKTDLNDENNIVEISKIAVKTFNEQIKSRDYVKTISYENQGQFIKVLQQVVIKINNLQGTVPPQLSVIEEDETISRQQIIIKKRAEVIEQINHDFRQLKEFIKSKNKEIETLKEELLNTTNQYNNLLSKLSERFNLEYSEDLAEKCINHIDKHQEPLLKEIKEQKDYIQELESAISIIHFRLIAIVCNEVPSNSTSNLKQIINSIYSILTRLQDEYEAKNKKEIEVQQTINALRQTLIKLDQQMIQSSGESQILNLKQPSNSELIESVQKHATIVCTAARGDESIRIAEIEDSFALVKQFLPEALQMSPKRYIRLFCDKYRELMHTINLLPSFNEILKNLIQNNYFEKEEKIKNENEINKIIEHLNGLEKSLQPKLIKINEIESYVNNSILLITKLYE